VAKRKSSAVKKTTHKPAPARSLKHPAKHNRSLADGVREAFNASSPNKSSKSIATGNTNTLANSSNAPKKSVLGRGLSALMSTTVVSIEPKPELSIVPQAITEEAEDAVIKTPQLNSEAFTESISEQAAPDEVALPTSTTDAELGPLLRYIPVEEIVRNEDQPRQYFSESELDTLAKSIKETGLLQPIVVRPKQSLTGRACFEIVAGERRFRAAKRAGLSKIPTLLRELSDRETLELGIIENVQRSDLNPIEEARAYQRLIEDFGQTQSEVAETVGRDRVSVANTLRLLKLADEVQLLLVTKEITAGHGRALLMVENKEEQKRFAKRILTEGLSVRALEALVSKSPKEEGSSKPRKHPSLDKSPAVLGLEDRFRRALGTKVSLTVDSNKQGELRISFFSEAELESLLERLNA
jgi:ParB family chromosome partitioning protein